MATVNAVVLKHHKKKTDNTWNVKIRINHKSKSAYMDTHAFVNKVNLTPKDKLKQNYIDRYFSEDLSKYREEIALLGTRLNFMSAIDIKDYLITKQNAGVEIELFAHLESEAARLINLGKSNQAHLVTNMSKYLKQFTGVEKLPAQMITPQVVKSFVDFLVSYKRENGLQFKANTVNSYMAQFQGAFKRLREKVNNPVTNDFPLAFNPFEGYRPLVINITARRNLSLDLLLQVFNYNPEGINQKLAKDMFMLSFYLCGMNTKDILENVTDPDAKVIEYRRSKIMNKRKDGGLINVLVPEQAASLVKAYAGILQPKYKTIHNLNYNLYIGWKAISEKIGFKCTMYYARHTFANIARQICKFSKEEVSLALNHKSGSDVTDIYIEPDWSVVHKVQAGVVQAVENYIKNSSGHATE